MAGVVAHRLVKRYGQQEALRSIDIEIEEGEIFGLLGPNGAGKTTFVSILATLRPFEEGTVEVCGHRLPEESQRVREILGIVPQDLALYDGLTAWDNLSYFGGLYSLPRKLLRERITQALEIVGLSARARQRVSTFSGGMKRRLNLAAGLLHRPRLLLLDEPTVGVDPQSRNRIFEAIRELNRETGMTILYTTHYMEEAEGLCDRVAIIDDGVLVACATVPTLLQQVGSAALRVEFDEAVSAFGHNRLATHPCFSSVSVVDGALHLSTDALEEALAALLDLARQEELRVRDIQVRRPSLQEVFLKLTGKELRD